MLAANSLFPTVVSFLLQSGADCKLTNVRGQTALHFCVASTGPADDEAVDACEGIIGQLIDAGVSVRAWPPACCRDCACTLCCLSLTGHSVM